MDYDYSGKTSSMQLDKTNIRYFLDIIALVKL